MPHQALFDKYIVPAIKEIFPNDTPSGCRSILCAGYSYTEGSSDKEYFINVFRAQFSLGSRYFILTRWGRRSANLQHKIIVATADNVSDETFKLVRTRMRHGYVQMFNQTSDISVIASSTSDVGSNEEI